MPKNLSALIRYRTIDECLRRVPKRCTWKYLANACAEALYELEGIENIPSERTIRGDLQKMKSGHLGYEAPIINIREAPQIAGYYRYSNPEFSITNYPITEEEVSFLRKSIHVIQHFKEFSFLKEATTIINKLDKKILANTRIKQSIIGLEHIPDACGLKKLDSIYSAISNKEVLCIDYLPFHKKVPITYSEIHPFYLKEYRNRWFLFAYSIHPDFDPSIFNFGLERILKIKRTEKLFSTDLTFSPSEYFKHIIGVTRPIDGCIEKIILSVKATQAPYITTKPIHHSQRILSTNDELVIIQLEMIINYELIREIIGFMDKVKVIAPVSLKAEIKACLIKMIAD